MTRNVQLNGTGSDSSTTIIERRSGDSGNGTTPTLLYEGHSGKTLPIQFDITTATARPAETNLVDLENASFGRSNTKSASAPGPAKYDTSFGCSKKRPRD